jgi:hypothetical protein
MYSGRSLTTAPRQRRHRPESPPRPSIRPRLPSSFVVGPLSWFVDQTPYPERSRSSDEIKGDARDDVEQKDPGFVEGHPGQVDHVKLLRRESEPPAPQPVEPITPERGGMASSTIIPGEPSREVRPEVAPGALLAHEVCVHCSIDIGQSVRPAPATSIRGGSW